MNRPEQIAERGVALPVQDQAAQQVRTAQERAVIWRGTAHHHVIAAAGAGMAAIQHEFVGPEPALAGLFIHGFGGGDAFAPGCRGVDDLSFRDRAQPPRFRHNLRCSGNRKHILGAFILHRNQPLALIQPQWMTIN